MNLPKLPDPRRTGLLLVHRLTDDLKPLGLALAVLLGINVLTLVLFHHSFLQEDGGRTWVMASGAALLFAASSAFRPMHEGKSATDWLLWPASSGEKFTAAALEVLVVLPVGLTAAAVVGSALLSALGFVLTGQFTPVWGPWQDFSLMGVWSFLAVLTVFFGGSALFKKNALWKTALLTTGILVVAVFLVVQLALGWSAGPEAHGFSLDNHGGRWDWRMPSGPSHDISQGGKDFLIVWAEVWFWVVVPAFSLTFAWAKVREKEARDEVQ